MSQRPRSPKAARRASFGRAERLRREAGGSGKPAAPKEARAPQEQARARPARVARQRRPTPAGRAQERVERSREASDRRYQARLKEQTRRAFNTTAERRRDATGRIERDRKQQALQEKERRIAEHGRRANLRRLELKKGELRRDHARAADRRQDAARRAEHARQQQRQQDLQRRAATQIEQEQKRRAEDLKAAQRRQMDAVEARQGVVRNSFRINGDTAMERHHHAIKGIDRREHDRLDELAGRRKGLPGMAAKLVPGNRARYERQVDEIRRGCEAERLAKHREFEAFKVRASAQQQKTSLDHARELKELSGRHRQERETFSRDQEAERPRQIEGRALALDRADQAQQQQQERDRAGQAREAASREDARPSSEFGRAAEGRAHEPGRAPSALTHGEGREMPSISRAFERA